MTRPDGDIAGAVAAHRRLLADLAGLQDDQIGRPSRLPDWTVGHVLTHIARNADSFVRIGDAARRGLVVEQYDGGAEARNAAIAAGSRRRASEVVADVEQACARLEEHWESLDDRTWQRGEGVGSVTNTPLTVRELPWRRWRETTVHHSDLGLGFTWREWDEHYVAREWEFVQAALAERLGPAAGWTPPGEVDRREVVAWALGRHERPDWPVLAPW